MRTKTLVLAAAALAAGFATSMAQSNVYSVNVVGYINVVYKGGGYTLVANPLDDGNGNQMTNLVAALPNKSSVLMWDGTSFSISASKTAGAWSTNYVIAPGTGFFVKNGIVGNPDITNTFVGSVIVAPGATNSRALPANYVLVGSAIPFAGDLTSDTNINLVAVLPNKSQVLRWDANASPQGYVGSSKTAGAWGSPVNVGAGEGFFVKSGGATNWLEIMPQ